MIKVIFLTQVLPYPPNSGPKVKTYNLIKYLSDKVDLTLVSFVRGDQSEEIEVLKGLCSRVVTVPIQRSLLRDGWALIRSIGSGLPWLMVRDDRLAMRQAVKQLAETNQYDIVHADQLNMAQYALQVPSVRRVLDAHNALWLLYRRLSETMSFGLQKWLFTRDWKLLKKFEAKVCNQFDAVLAVSQEDKHAFEEAVGHELNINVIPITVDLDENLVIQRNLDAEHILHIGTMYWAPNIDGILWFIEKVLPLIQKEKPDVKFDIVGARPPREIMEIGDKQPGINVTGYVVDTIPYIKQAGLMVVPLRAGGGMRVKILNAFANGIPVVSTTIGCEGIAVESGHHLLVADTPEDFAYAVLRVLENTNLANELGRNGRTLIEEKYDSNLVCQSVLQVYQS